jgi:hypothetical protein
MNSTIITAAIAMARCAATASWVGAYHSVMPTIGASARPAH